jgi:folate-binding protein YgfZ
MSDASHNPLKTLHEQADAEFQDYAGVEIVSTYGQPQAEYAAVHKSVALIDLPQRGLLEFTGKDRHTFLNNLLTQQLVEKPSGKVLTQGQGVYAFYLNIKGRVVTDLNILERGDRTLLEMDARLVDPVRNALERYLFSEQVTMTSRLNDLHVLGLHGPASAGVLGELSGAVLPELGELASVAISIGDNEVIVFRDDICGVSGYGLIASSAQAPDLWTKLTTAADPAHQDRKRIRPIGWAVFNAARIEAGRAIFGIDFENAAPSLPGAKANGSADAEPRAAGVLPAETGLLDRAVSFTKGCYLGQEIVARMHARQQVARMLVGFRMDADALPLAGTEVMDDKHNQIGAVTSSTVSPILSNACIGLAIVRKGFFQPGAMLQIPAEGAVQTARVVQLPFVKAGGAA